MIPNEDDADEDWHAAADGDEPEDDDEEDDDEEDIDGEEEEEEDEEVESGKGPPPTSMTSTCSLCSDQSGSRRARPVATFDFPSALELSLPSTSVAFISDPLGLLALAHLPIAISRAHTPAPVLRVQTEAKRMCSWRARDQLSFIIVQRYEIFTHPTTAFLLLHSLELDLMQSPWPTQRHHRVRELTASS